MLKVNRRLLCFFAAALLSVFMIVPVFASSVNGSGYNRAAVQIDSITLLNGTYSGSVVDWPNNMASSSGGFLTGETNVLGYIASFTGNLFETELYLGSANSFRLRSSDYFWAADTVFMLDDGGFDNLTISSVTVSGNLMSIASGSSKYYFSAFPFSSTFSVNAREVDLNNLIRYAVGEIEAYGDLVYIQDLQITVNFYLDAGLQPGTNVGLYFTVSNAKYDNYYLAWFDSFSLSYTVNNYEVPGLYDWLLESVNAFLNFEIAPGFSLNKMFWITLVIGVILWFITLLI